MLLLTSDGLTSKKLIKAVKEALVIVSGKAGLVTTASVGLKERDSNVEILRQQFAELGLATECVDLEFQDISLLLQYDVVMLIGGNPCYLLKHMRKWRNSREILLELARKRVLMGISAGSMVLGNTLEFAVPVTPEMVEEAGGMEDFSAFGLVDVNLMPHYKAYLTCYPGMDGCLQQYEAETGNRVFRLNDKEGLWYDIGAGICRYLKDSLYRPKVSVPIHHEETDAVIFDFYGTILDVHTWEDNNKLWEKLALMLRYHGIAVTAQEFREEFDRRWMAQMEKLASSEGWDPEAVPQPDTEEIFCRMLQVNGILTGHEEASFLTRMYRSLSTEYIRPYYHAPEFVAELKAAGHPVYLCASGERCFAEGEIRAFGMEGLFSDLSFSSDYGRTKANLEQLALLMEKHQLQPERTLVIGHDPGTSVWPGHVLGARTCLIHSFLSPDFPFAGKWKPECDILMKVVDYPLLAEILGLL